MESREEKGEIASVGSGPNSGGRDCLLCGKPADSLEHYIPAWLSRETGRGGDPIVRGTAIDGAVVDNQPRGNSLGAKHRNLCARCNSALGERLEGPICQLLRRLVAPVPIDNRSAYLNEFLPRERHLLAWWGILRAVQLNEQFERKRISPELKGGLIAGLREVSEGRIPNPPRGYFLEIATGREADWGFMLTRQIFERERGVVEGKERDSFLWSMQANHFLMIGLYAPESQLMKDRGWGYGIAPFDARQCSAYRNMKEFVELSHIDTRLPKIYGPRRE